MRDSRKEENIIGSRKASLSTRKRGGFQVFSMMMLQAGDIILCCAYEVHGNLREADQTSLKRAISSILLLLQFSFTKTPPADVDIVMAAPRMIGEGVRETYLNGTGFPAFVGVAQDASGKALEYGKALCKAIGSTKMGAIEVQFKDETMLDLMTEQATWPIIYNVFHEVFLCELEHGHPEEAVLMEEYMSKEPAEMRKAAEMGLFKQLPLHSHTSQFGQLRGYHMYDTSRIREFVRDRYDQIANGTFAKAWTREQQENHLADFSRMEKEAMECDMSKAEERLKERLNMK